MVNVIPDKAAAMNSPALRVFEDAMLAGIAFRRIDIIIEHVAARLVGGKQLAAAIVNAINLAVAFDDGRAIEVLVHRLLQLQFNNGSSVALVNSIRLAIRLHSVRAFNALCRTLAHEAQLWP
jgi:hypothetical protein